MIDLRHLLLNLVPIPLHQTPGNNQFPRTAGLFVPGHLQNRIDGFLLGRVDETACVNHDDFRIGRISRNLMPARGEHTHHDFRVDEVFGTT